jgi:PAS domain S-box-containing protein
MEDQTQVGEDEGGRLYYQGIVIDVTDRKVAEEARLETRRRLEEILEHVQLIAVTLDEQGRLTFCNRYLLDLAGATSEQVLGQAWFERFAVPDDRPLLRENFRAAMEGKGFPLHHEARFVAARGEQRAVAWDNTLLHDPDGRVTGLASFGRDVTEQRRLEVQYRQAQKMEAVGQLAGGIAHDFNNLLQVISGYASMALDRLVPGDALYEEVGEIRRASDRAAALVRQLLAFSRRQAMERRPMDLNETIGNLLKMLRRVIGEHIDLGFTPGAAVPPVMADANQVEQILVNLLLNARDAMPGGGRIDLATAAVEAAGAFREGRPWAKDAAYVLLAVTDSGPGIPLDVVDRIFEPFFTTKEVGRGTGLGLATVYGIVNQHDGMIEVETSPGRGTTFKVYLPSAGDVEGRQEAPASAPVHAPVQGTILVAEDEDMVRLLAVRVLEGAGFRVIVARDGEEALEVVEARAEEIDLALLDVVMPKVSGVDVHRRLRAVRPGVPVLFSSGYSRQMLDSAFLSLESVELVQKPYEPRTLLARVRALLGARPAGA